MSHNHDTGTVSYTHLDVYKRQLIYSVVGQKDEICAIQRTSARRV